MRAKWSSPPIQWRLHPALRLQRCGRLQCFGTKEQRAHPLHLLQRVRRGAAWGSVMPPGLLMRVWHLPCVRWRALWMSLWGTGAASCWRAAAQRGAGERAAQRQQQQQRLGVLHGHSTFSDGSSLRSKACYQAHARTAVSMSSFVHTSHQSRICRYKGGRGGGCA